MTNTALSEAIREAYATAPVAEVILHTLEIRHAAFTQPIRVVCDHRDLLARLEADAPLDAGQWVTFNAFAFEPVPPGSSQQPNPEMQVKVDNVGREISDALDLAVESGTPAEITYRPYLASDPAQPEMTPVMHMTLISAQLSQLSVALRAGFPDFANRKFPGEDYTAARFPGLI